MSVDNYKDSMKYELFIRNAHKCDRGMRYGADVCFMNNAMSMEQGETFAKHLGSFDKQFTVVKGYVIKALEKVLKTKAYNPSYDFFDAQLQSVYSAYSTNELMRIVSGSLEELIKYKKD